MNMKLLTVLIILIISCLLDYSTSFYHGIKNVAYQYPRVCDTNPETPYNARVTCFSHFQCESQCNIGYELPDKRTSLALICDQNVWYVSDSSYDTIPHCQPRCEPNCENNGICTAPNVCVCPDNFHGKYCEYDKNVCLSYPTMPLNSQRTCGFTVCIISCLDGYAFPDGSLIAKAMCQNSNWVSTKPGEISIPDCKPICTRQCENGGVCISKDVCQCSHDFRGSSCQYSIDECSTKKLRFNGGYNCSGDSTSITCILSCPLGVPFEFPPQDYYHCEYAEGTFNPQPIPMCVLPQGIDIIPVHLSSNTNVNGHDVNPVNELNKKLWLDYLSNWRKFKDQFYSVHSTDLRPITYNEFSLNLMKKVQVSPKPGICLTWSGLHYKTFDGQIFSIDSNCLNILLQDTEEDSIRIAAKNTEKRSKIITIFIDNKEYVLKLDNDGIPVFLLGDKKQTIPSRLSTLSIDTIGLQTVINFDPLGVVLKWDGKQMIQIKINENLWNKTGGLCGNLDGYAKNDLIAKNGLSIHENVKSFVNDWQIDKETCDNSFSQPDHICDRLKNEQINEESLKLCHDLLTHDQFQECFQNVDPLRFIEACRWDYCSCNSHKRNNCVCETANVYVRECLEAGFESVRNWRTNQLCALNCTGGRKYEPCNINGEITCENFHQIDARFSSEPKCEEGCFCTPDTVLINGTCNSKDLCPCTYRGKFYQSNSTISKDCNTCTCLAGQWKCTQVLCGSRCSVIGDPHYKTFDGRFYDFMGQCSYYLLKADNYSIATENVACAGSISESLNLPKSIANEFPSCTKSVMIFVGDKMLHLKQHFEIMLDQQQIENLPFTNAEFSVRKASSIFVIVRLTNGLEIWWDGLNRVYLDAPAYLRGHTKGLCGTFNDNQKDDLLTPEGDVEELVLPFANKWSIQEKCESIPNKIHEHPCNSDFDKKKSSEDYCHPIKSNLFSQCHTYVDPEIYYKNCLYDLCSCETSPEDCLCPLMAAYAQECADLGIYIDWRTDIRICGMNCNGGQVYDLCGNSCTTSCADLSLFADFECPDSCAEGCHCPEGESLNENGECIPISKCPCEKFGIEFPAGYQLIDQIKKELCTCMNAVWSCKSANDDEVAKFPNKFDTLKVICNGSNNEEFTTCEPSVPITCQNMHKIIEPEKPIICNAGCQCKLGHVLDSLSKQCITPKECPCHHGGHSYNENEVIESECNSCVCQNRSWICTGRSCPSTCSVWGDSHYRTFDGKVYDFQGLCGYVFSKGIIDNDNKFEILVQNIVCGSFGVTCSKSITVNLGTNSSVALDKNNGLDVRNLGNSEITVKQSGLFLFVEMEKLEFSLKWDQGTRLYLSLGSMWKDKVTGLCGNFNENELDDFKTSSGDVIEVSVNLFADSWRLQTYCPKVMEVNDVCGLRPNRKVWATKQCNVLKSKLFAKCHSEVEFMPYFEKCVFDSCACDSGGDCECLCTALAAYAFECNVKGVFLKWRSQKLCPIQCELGFSYNPCVSECALESCRNTANYQSVSNSCSDKGCVEGCSPNNCPLDHVFVNESYSSCIHKSLCRPSCLEMDGKVYYENETMEENECHVCYCFGNEKLCEELPCMNVTTISYNGTKTTISQQWKQLDDDFKCQTKWTDWFNENKPYKEPKYYLENEPITKKVKELCLHGKFSKIECRTVSTHLNSKESGSNADCSLENGLKCTSKITPCDDFEIRLYCNCQVDNQSSCDPLVPHVEDLQNCSRFYHCVPRDGYTELVRKHCEFGTIFNPKTLICDWPEIVYDLKPACREPEVYHNAIPCDHVCNSYLHKLREEDTCLSGSDCSACFNGFMECPESHFWSNFETCGPIQDCSCVSKYGDIVQPGATFNESSCEICQCIDNVYICNKTECDLNLLGSSTQFSDTTNWSVKQIFKLDTTTDSSLPKIQICTLNCPKPSCPAGYSIVEQPKPQGCPIYECKITQDDKKLSCSSTVCQGLQNDTEYEYKLVESADTCCPVQERVACNHDGITYHINESWHSDIDKCNKYVCKMNEKGIVSKIEIVETCSKRCPSGWTYEVKDNECCGQCVQKLCVFDNYTYMIGESWEIADTCTYFSCEKTSEGSLFISVKQTVCSSVVEDCPTENRNLIGCCIVCNRTESLKNCLAYDIDGESTVKMIQEFKYPHGLCTNLYPISDMKECRGACDSKTTFDSDINDFQRVCSCCQPVNIKNILVELECEDGFKIRKKITVPQNCDCSKYAC